VPLVQDDDVIQTLPAYAAEQPLLKGFAMAIAVP
jgi:hypothetical protein